MSANGEVRLYYSVASSPDLGEANTWNGLPDDEKRNQVWSIRIGKDGNFDTSDIRREFLVPDFFFNPQDIARAGLSRPVSDITFPQCSDRPLMLIAERGGIRNLGLDVVNPFATPHEARTLRYELHQDGVWRPVGRYDVGSYFRFAEGAPYMFANCAGGAAFGYGYTPSWTIDEQQLNQYVWITGDSLCSSIGMCRAPAGGQQGSEQAEGDPSEVHGIQGLKESLFAELAPASAYADLNPQQGYATENVGLDQSYLIDVDVNVDASGTVIYEELTSRRLDQDRRYRDLRVLRRAVVWVRAGDGAAAGDDLRTRPFADREPFALGLAQCRIQPLPLRIALAGHEP